MIFFVCDMCLLGLKFGFGGNQSFWSNDENGEKLIGNPLDVPGVAKPDLKRGKQTILLMNQSWFFSFVRSGFATGSFVATSYQI